MKEFKAGDRVRISKDGKATKGTGAFLPGKEALLGKITIFNCRYQDNLVWCDEIGTPYSWEWHPDDITPLDSPSIDLLQMGDVIRLRNGVIKMVTHTEQACVDYLYHDCNDRLSCSHNNFCDNSLKSHKGLPELDIMAIYAGGNLDNILNQSTEGLTLIWERQELSPAEQKLAEAKEGMAQAQRLVQEAEEELRKEREDK